MAGVRDGRVEPVRDDVGVTDDDPAAAMINRIRNARFRTTRIRPGYDDREVDTYLDEAISLLAAGQPPVPPAGFSANRRKPGYVRDDVDALIAEITAFSPRLPGLSLGLSRLA
jgi:DivIVA domain-containing protein